MENEPVDFGTISTITLDKIEMALSHAVDPSVLMGVHADRYIDQMTERVAFQIRGYLLGEKLKGKIIKHPRDWWQSFKERWFPAWALKRWPVEYTIHTVTFDVIYPDFKPSLPPRHSRHTVIANYENSEGDEEGRTWDY